jgi:hypothetical protein
MPAFARAQAIHPLMSGFLIAEDIRDVAELEQCDGLPFLAWEADVQAKGRRLYDVPTR